MLNKTRAVIESGILDFLFFGAFWLFYLLFLNPPRESLITRLLIIAVHYTTALLGGYWAGWRARHDGWIYGIFGYGLFRGLTFLLNVHAPLPYPLHVKILGYVPILALLMYGAVIGEQRAYYVETTEQNVTGIYPVVKRTADFIVGATGLLLLGPVMLAIAFGIKVSSPGPIFFHQRRIGQDGQPINIIKFRTMRTDAEQVLPDLPQFQTRSEPYVKLREDPRVFAFGKFLRTTSLDELPQLMNILKGEMSLVGPRPLISSEIEHCEGEQLKRLEVKPGLTGWAQINGRGNLTFEELLMMDLEYVKKQSLWLDLRILLSTMWMVLMRHGAY